VRSSSAPRQKAVPVGVIGKFRREADDAEGNFRARIVESITEKLRFAVRFVGNRSIHGDQIAGPGVSINRPDALAIHEWVPGGRAQKDRWERKVRIRC
jgi:hypothetical protein